MGLPKTSAEANRFGSNVLIGDTHRDLPVSEPEEDHLDALRGLLWASLLAAPFWIALYLLLRWLMA